MSIEWGKTRNTSVQSDDPETQLVLQNGQRMKAQEMIGQSESWFVYATKGQASGLLCEANGRGVGVELPDLCLGAIHGAVKLYLSHKERDVPALEAMAELLRQMGVDDLP